MFRYPAYVCLATAQVTIGLCRDMLDYGWFLCFAVQCLTAIRGLADVATYREWPVLSFDAQCLLPRHYTTSTFHSRAMERSETKLKALPLTHGFTLDLAF